MQSARLDRKITLQQYTTTQNEYGELEEAWTDYDEVWAQIAQQGGREMFSAGKVAEIDKVFKIRYLSAINTTWRIVYDGENYDISSIKELGRQDALELAAKAQT